MKTVVNSLIGAFLFLFFLSGASAQQFKGGLLAGGVSSQVAGDNISGFHKAGISFGGYVRLKLDDHSGLQLELFFVQKGSRTSDQDVKAGLNPYLLRLNYVEMPLIYQYDLGKLRLEAGLSAAFLASHYEEVNYLDNTQDVWRSFNFSSIVGVRYLFHEHWSLGLRSINSISSIRKNRVDGNVKRYGNKFGAFNDVLQLAVFYSF
ncbi:MAG: porin family protein [Bacteroidales bacterium]|jgi:hypothetical protein|nr:porin family protein [Bacteroidales bacterium]